MAAGAHQNGCHSAHTCPSDHHSYIWYDSSGAGFDCVEPGAPEFNPATDTSTITYAGLTYYCQPVGGATPPPPPALCQAKARYPDKHCTPGAAFPSATTTQVCRPGYTKRVRKVSQATKDRVFARYGITYHRPFSYEVDHLIPLELGGSNTLGNLWPEPYGGSTGARVKDRLENALHRDVCAGRVTLRAAQHKIATDWYRTWIKEGRP